MSKRTEIRNALRDALLGLPLTGSNVFLTRSRPLSLSECPAILVFSGVSEVVDQDMDGIPAQLRWELRADVIVIDGQEDAADTILDQMVVAVSTSESLAATGALLRLSGVGEIDLEQSLERPALRLPVLFSCEYIP